MTTKPVLLAEDDGPTVLQAIERDLRREYGCAGYLVPPFSKETVLTLEFRRCDPSSPAFLPGSHILLEGNGCSDHDGCSTCSPSAIRLVSRCVRSSPAMLTLWQPGWVPCLHHATPGVLPPNPSCL